MLSTHSSPWLEPEFKFLLTESFVKLLMDFWFCSENSDMRFAWQNSDHKSYQILGRTATHSQALPDKSQTWFTQTWILYGQRQSYLMRLISWRIVEDSTLWRKAKGGCLGAFAGRRLVTEATWSGTTRKSMYYVRASVGENKESTKIATLLPGVNVYAMQA